MIYSLVKITRRVNNPSDLSVKNSIQPSSEMPIDQLSKEKKRAFTSLRFR